MRFAANCLKLSSHMCTASFFMRPLGAGWTPVFALKTCHPAVRGRPHRKEITNENEGYTRRRHRGGAFDAACGLGPVPRQRRQSGHKFPQGRGLLVAKADNPDALCGAEQAALETVGNSGRP